MTFKLLGICILTLVSFRESSRPVSGSLIHCFRYHVSEGGLETAALPAAVSLIIGAVASSYPYVQHTSPSFKLTVAFG